MNTIGILRDKRYLDHIPGPTHIEGPRRLEAIFKYLDEQFGPDDFKPISPRYATEEELAMNHDPTYVERVKETSRHNGFVSLDPDTTTCPKSYDTARLAVGGVFEAIDQIIDGSLTGAFCLVRPPGHHAERNRAMGFCLFNNVALGARYARKRYGIERILIVDWDLHHGNGTQHSFWYDPGCLYFSTHLYPYYPGTGGVHECGEGPGEGFTVNCPLDTGCTDQDYAFIFKDLLGPIALQYQPGLILVSAGFDIYKDDPLGGMAVTEKGFSAIARALIDLAKRLCGGRIIFLLEGGYNLKGLGHGVVAVAKQLLERPKDLKAIENARDLLTSATPIRCETSVQAAKEVQRHYWRL